MLERSYSYIELTFYVVDVEKSYHSIESFQGYLLSAVNMLLHPYLLEQLRTDNLDRLLYHYIIRDMPCDIDLTAISAIHEAPISVLVDVYAIYFSFICLWVFAMATKYSEVVFTKKNLACNPAGYFSILYV